MGYIYDEILRSTMKSFCLGEPDVLSRLLVMKPHSTKHQLTIDGQLSLFVIVSIVGLFL